MQHVSFTRMDVGTQQDYLFLHHLEQDFNAALPDRLMVALEDLKESFGGYQVTRYEHCVQTASRALRDGRDDEYVAMSLVHDIGDTLAPFTHSEMIAAVLRPFVRPEIHWIAKHHAAFQLYYYGHHLGEDRNARDVFRGSEWFDATAEFCEKYDQMSFDPNYESLTTTDFEPILRRVFSKPRYLKSLADATGAEG